MNINDCYPSKYVSAGDLKGRELTVTIRQVVVENLAAPGQPVDEKPVVYFTGAVKGLGLNKTNAATISAQFGPETTGWLGKAITLFPTQTDFKGQTVACIRIKLDPVNLTPPQQIPLDEVPQNAIDAANADLPAGDEIPF